MSNYSQVQSVATGCCKNLVPFFCRKWYTGKFVTYWSIRNPKRKIKIKKLWVVYCYIIIVWTQCHFSTKRDLIYNHSLSEISPYVLDHTYLFSANYNCRKTRSSIFNWHSSWKNSERWCTAPKTYNLFFKCLNIWMHWNKLKVPFN